MINNFNYLNKLMLTEKMSQNICNKFLKIISQIKYLI